MRTINQECRTVGSSCYYGEHGDWFIAMAIHRDSDALSRSNFEVAKSNLETLPAVKNWQGEQCPVQIERFGHWAVGWVDYLVVDPACAEAMAEAEAMRARLEDYPILDEHHYSEVETEEANEVWQHCYNVRERLAYIREHRGQFDFRDLRDILACVRGKYFAGYAGELLN